MTHLLLVATCCALPILGFSQQNTVTSGGDATSSSGSVSYSIGQVDYSNASGSDGSSNEGVQQPFEFFDPDASIANLEWDASLFPNPTNDKIILHFENVPENAVYQLYDAKGKLLITGSIRTEDTTIDVSSFATGSYLLEMNSSTKSTKSIKIIKH